MELPLACPECLGPIGRLYRCAVCGYRGRRIDGIPVLTPRGTAAWFRDSEWFAARLGGRWRRHLRRWGPNEFARRIAEIAPVASSARIPVTQARIRLARRASLQAAPASSGETELPLRWIVKQVARREISTMLDIGCGGGYLLLELAALLAGKRRSIAAVDLDFLCARVTQSRLRKQSAEASVYCADCRSLPFATGTFDCVTSNFGLSHVVGWRRAVGEVHRVLRPGGVIVACETEFDRLLKGLPRSKNARLAIALGLHGGTKHLRDELGRCGFAIQHMTIRKHRELRWGQIVARKK